MAAYKAYKVTLLERTMADPFDVYHFEVHTGSNCPSFPFQISLKLAICDKGQCKIEIREMIPIY